jgi:hypothetical protein
MSTAARLLVSAAGSGAGRVCARLDRSAVFGRSS